jgi:hypothetical protein
MPARKPAMVPHTTSVFCAQLPVHSAGVSAKNIARLAAMMSDRIKPQPKIFVELPFFTSSSENLFSLIHALPNNIGEYQTPPNTNAEMPATSTASQLIEFMSIQLICGLKNLFVFESILQTLHAQAANERNRN